jgi:hypothetical protein
MIANTKRLIRNTGMVLFVACAVNAAMGQAVYNIASGGLESFNMSMDGQTYNSALAGSIDLNYVSGKGSSFASVCTDFSGTLYLGYNYSFAAPATFSGNTGLDPTWGAGNANGLHNAANASAAIQAAADIFYKFGGILSSSSTSQSTLDAKAGLQLAVWAALYNTTAGTSSITLSGAGDRFNVLSASTATWSGSWGNTYAGTIGAISDASYDLSQVNFSDQYSGNIMTPSPTNQYGLTGQEVLTSVTPTTTGFTPVPEPTTWIAGSLLLLPFAASTLRSLWGRRRRVVKR